MARHEDEEQHRGRTDPNFQDRFEPREASIHHVPDGNAHNNRRQRHRRQLQDNGHPEHEAAGQPDSALASWNSRQLSKLSALISCEDVELLVR